MDYLEKRQISLMNDLTEIYSGLQEQSEEAEYAYQQCDVIYIAEAPKPKSRQPLQSIYRVMDAIFTAKEDAKVVIKAHPTLKSLEAVFDMERYPKVYIDYRTVQIESILLKMEIDNKIVITGNSTSALYIKWVYGKAPYMILMQSEHKKELEEYACRFIESYDTEKSYAPENEEELKKVLGLILAEKAGNQE